MNYDRHAFFIGNEWVPPSSSDRFEIVAASTGERIATVPEGRNADVDRAVAAARHAFDHSGWASATAAERGVVIERFMAALSKRSADLARTVSLQNGMPISLSTMLEGQFSLGILNYYAELARSMDIADVRASQFGKTTLVTRSPVGVVAAVIPWNFPVALSLSKIAPAMAAGCTLVIKPSPGTVLDSYIVAEAALEAEVPAGVLNWVAADRAVGAYLVSHPDVDKVAFTGSTAAGRKIAAVCGELLRPVTLELGGKSAAVLLEDADVPAFVEAMPMVSMLNNGQACFNCTRVLVPSGRRQDVVDALAAKLGSLRIGEALDPGTEVGPMASSAHRDRVEGYVARGKQEARLIVGGGRPKSLDRGWFVEPSLFVDVDQDAAIWREEIFGPVISVMGYDDEEQAIRIANDSEFGLGGTVWSSDADHALKVAHALRSGTVGVNGYMPSLGSPFGGIKASGLGREFGPEALAAYQSLKSIYVMA